MCLLPACIGQLRLIPKRNIFASCKCEPLSPVSPCGCVPAPLQRSNIPLISGCADLGAMRSLAKLWKMEVFFCSFPLTAPTLITRPPDRRQGAIHPHRVKDNRRQARKPLNLTTCPSSRASWLGTVPSRVPKSLGAESTRTTQRCSQGRRTALRSCDTLSPAPRQHPCSSMRRAAR